MKMNNHPKLFYFYVALCLVTAISAIAIGVWQGTLKEPGVITHFETREVIDEVRVPYPVLVIEEKPVRIWVEHTMYPELRHFESKPALRAWLEDHPVVVCISPWWDCEDYAIELQELAGEDGYYMSVQYDYKHSHMLNGCQAGDNEWFLIEPQTREIISRFKMDR